MKIVSYVITFVAVFIVALMLLFPYDKLAKTLIDTQLAQYHIPVTYADIRSGLFSTKVSGLEYNGNLLGDIKVAYTPVSVITKRIKAVVDSPFGKAEAKYKGTTLTLNAVPDAGRISRLFGQNFEGEPVINAVYDTSTMKGSFNVTSGAFTAQSPIGSVLLDGFDGEGLIDGKVLHIDRFETRGSYVISLNGAINIDTFNIRRSPLSLNGEANIMGAKSRFTVRGTLGNPQPILQ